MKDYNFPNISKLSDDDLFFPGQFDYAQTETLSAILEELAKRKEESEIETKQNTHCFIISTVISILALCASLVAAIAAVIPLIYN